MSHTFRTSIVKLCQCIIIAVILLNPATSSAQLYKQRKENLKANSNWFFWSFLVDMNQNPPTATFAKNVYNKLELHSIYERLENAVPVSDPETGVFLFVALKNEILDRNYNIMPNSFLDTDTFRATYERSIAVAPVINNPGKYYFFNLSIDSTTGLTYSIIDMTLNQGNGDIVENQKAIPLKAFGLPNVTGPEIVDIIPGNNCDLWLVITEAVYSDLPRNFYAFNITAAGINPTPVTSQLQRENIQDQYWDFQASPNRDQIAYIATKYKANGAETEIKSSVNFLTFDPENGNVIQSNKPPILFEGDGEVGHGIHGTFTPDNNYYIAYTYGGISNTYNTVYNIQTESAKFYKYDLHAPQNNYSRSSFYVDQFWIPFNIYRHLDYLWPIYFFKPYNNDIFFSQPYPNENVSDMPPGIFMYPLNAASLGRFSPQGERASWENFSQTLSLPLNKYAGFYRGCDVIYPYRDTVTSIIMDSVLCYEAGFSFPEITLKARAGFDGYIWNDGTTNPEKQIVAPGKYWVHYNASCNHRVDTFIVRYRNAKVVLPPDTVVCEQRFPFDLTALPVYEDNWKETYTWDDGSGAKTRTINTPGTYFVAFQADGCTEYDTITIASQQCSCSVLVPNAFTPNGDGLNDFFKPLITPGCVPAQYSFRVFNRWGQMVYSSFNEFDQGWNGTYQGSQVAIGTYFYEIRFKSKYLNQEDYVKKGAITLVL